MVWGHRGGSWGGPGGHAPQGPGRAGGEVPKGSKTPTPQAPEWVPFGAPKPPFWEVPKKVLHVARIDKKIRPLLGGGFDQVLGAFLGSKNDHFRLPPPMAKTPLFRKVRFWAKVPLFGGEGGFLRVGQRVFGKKGGFWPKPYGGRVLGKTAQNRHFRPFLATP